MEEVEEVTVFSQPHNWFKVINEEDSGEIVSWMMHGADVNLLMDFKLEDAIHNSDEVLVEFEQVTPLHFVVFLNKFDLVQDMINGGADPNVTGAKVKITSKKSNETTTFEGKSSYQLSLLLEKREEMSKMIHSTGAVQEL